MSERGKRTSRHTYVHRAGFTVYGLAWAQQRDAFRLCLSSFIEGPRNKMQVVERDAQRDSLVVVAEADVAFPATKLLWAPMATGSSNLLAASSDFLRLYALADPPAPVTNSNGSFIGNTQQPQLRSLELRATLKPASARRQQQQQSKTSPPPLTAFDWNEADPSMCVTSSIDTTCTVWDVNRLEQKTQLIAHDKAVYDVAFSREPNSFASVGADGSVRMFDLRSLEHSTILYDTPPQLTPASTTTTTQTMENPPLLRISWNKLDSNYLATFQMDSKKVVILDVRVPSIPVTELYGHQAGVNAIAWAPHSSAHICTVADDSFALVWDIGNVAQKRTMSEPLLTYRAGEAINNLSWTPGIPEWIGVAVGDTIQALKV
ncbi:WD40 repeat-like protein [Rhizoclosmatium globosum]|uniref:WD40 repeat-like protein n=1 Tax=Rhizoclosmatium globosum TaxID=329046 RepID=A0A1Y2BUJ5_9FUNG|nr:ddb1 and cul4 associated factor 7 [Rhizoclosmatium sp. JEL0117]ORY38416.1 WD40 repeat-like protein [Rhizoclosmatium globosum]|eukprot:ORY38416.1 WD40 repeat-like protein [Rhizoclosmatium globosum]